MDGAIDWLEKNESKSLEDLLDSENADEPSSSSAANIQEEAASLRCDDCGKLFRNQSSAEYHANKSGHENFSESRDEIKPLTEEEKAAKLAELKEKAAARQQLKAEEEKLERKKERQTKTKTIFHPHPHL